LGLRGKMLAAGGLLGWLLWDKTRVCPHVRQSQFQLALKQTHHWSKLRPSALPVVSLWWR